MQRLICCDDIPKDLWEPEGEILHFPSSLINQWKELLEDNGLMDMAKEKAPDRFVGGMSKEDTDKHLAWRFTGSCARTMLSVLDPKEQLGEVSDAFAKAFAGNKIFLVDLPCGSGAATASILTTLAKLREEKVLPRLPLHIEIIGGEISSYARSYTHDFLEGIKECLAKQSITIEHRELHWDVCNPMSNSSLVKQLILQGQSCNIKLLMLTNFSDFLMRNSKWKLAKPQFDELFRHSRDQDSMAIWIEPASNEVKDGFFVRLSKWFSNLFSPIKKTDADIYEERYEEYHVHAAHPLKDHLFRVNSVVRRFDIPSEMLS